MVLKKEPIVSASRDKQFGQLILPALNCAICWEHLSPSLFVLYDLSQLAGNLIYLNSLGILRDSTPEFIFCGYPSSSSVSKFERMFSTNNCLHFVIEGRTWCWFYQTPNTHILSVWMINGPSGKVFTRPLDCSATKGYVMRPYGRHQQNLNSEIIYKISTN